MCMLDQSSVMGGGLHFYLLGHVCKLDQMYMYLFLKNYFLFKYQSIMHKYHYAMFMINVHCIMYNLYEAMKIK